MERTQQLVNKKDTKRSYKGSSKCSHSPTYPSEVFEESLKPDDCVKMLVNCMQNIEKHINISIFINDRIYQYF